MIPWARKCLARTLAAIKRLDVQTSVAAVPPMVRVRAVRRSRAAPAEGRRRPKSTQALSSLRPPRPSQQQLGRFPRELQLELAAEAL